MTGVESDYATLSWRCFVLSRGLPTSPRDSGGVLQVSSHSLLYDVLVSLFTSAARANSVGAITPRTSVSYAEPNASPQYSSFANAAGLPFH